MEIFLGLNEGSLRFLVAADAKPLPATVIKDLLKQMLQALDYLHGLDLVHRDVKPDNILFVKASPKQNSYHFQLGDFGLCDRTALAQGQEGTSVYMAPEVVQKELQTPKADIWSLFVTMLCAQDVNDFQRLEPHLKGPNDLFTMGFPMHSGISSIREMAAIDPAQRVSAAQMLVRHFHGEGLSTSPNRIPALSNLETPTVAQPVSTPARQLSTSLAQRRKRRRGANRRCQRAPAPPAAPSVPSLPMARDGTPSRWHRAENTPVSPEQSRNLRIENRQYR